MSNPTSGPWYRDGLDIKTQSRTVGARERKVGAAHIAGRTSVEAEANARLMASAPALLEACRELLSVYDLLAGDDPLRPIVYGQQVIEALREAVALAEGR